MPTSSYASASCQNSAFRVGPSAGLPDCRAYEQVSPSDKGGYDAVPRGTAASAQASVHGQRFAYSNYGSFPGAHGNTALVAGHLGGRSATSWQTSELTPAKSAPNSAAELSGYYFNEELTGTIVKTSAQATPEATPGLLNLFLRSEQGALSWLNAVTPPLLPPASCGTCFQSYDVAGYAGASTDLSRVFFESNAGLTPEAPPPLSAETLYEAVGGAVHLVGILPDGTAPSEGATAGAGSSAFYLSGSQEAIDQRLEHAVSSDGRQVVFQAAADGGIPDPAQSGMTEVYDRIDGESTTELSAPAPGATPANEAAEPAKFWAASADGSRVFFTSSAELTNQSNTGTSNNSEDLYEYNQFSAKHLTDLTVDTNPADSAVGAGVLGVVGASSDGAYVYFVAKGQLVEGKGVDGQPNLYLMHEGGQPVFIATLSEADQLDWTPYPTALQAYVTPDGRHIALMAVDKLPTTNFPSGYENVIPNSEGSLASEVYEYAAPTVAEEEHGEAGRLTCGSCDPAGAAPTGSAYIAGISSGGDVSTPFHQVRALSDNGARLFFTAPPLASERAFNGAETAYDKVYEREAPNEEPGGCRDPNGCTFLISSATNSSNDVFLDADATGDNVFFGTLSRLAPTDHDQFMDVYDAHVNGGILAPPEEEAECESECRTPAAIGAASPTLLSGFTGASGNLAASAAKTKVNAGKKRATRKPTRRTCVAHAKQIKRRRARKRALRRCAAAHRGRNYSRKHSERKGKKAMRAKHANRGRAGR